MRYTEKINWCADEPEGYAGPGECGQLCSGYIPRNKISGMCKHKRILQLTQFELYDLVANGYKNFVKHRKNAERRNHERVLESLQ